MKTLIFASRLKKNSNGYYLKIIVYTILCWIFNTIFFINYIFFIEIYQDVYFSLKEHLRIWKIRREFFLYLQKSQRSYGILLNLENFLKTIFFLIILILYYMQSAIHRLTKLWILL